MSCERLLKCPFCGGEAKMTESFTGSGVFVECTNCGATTLTFYYKDRINKATKAWNNRKPVDDVLERLEESIQIIKGELL